MANDQQQDDTTVDERDETVERDMPSPENHVEREHSNEERVEEDEARY